MRFLIELYGFPLRTTDLAINVNHSKLFEVSLAKGEPSPSCPWHKLRQRCRIFQLLLAPIPPSHKVEGHRMNYVKATQLQRETCGMHTTKIKDQPLICRRKKCSGILWRKPRFAILSTRLRNNATPGSGLFQMLIFTVITILIKSCL